MRLPVEAVGPATRLRAAAGFDDATPWRATDIVPWADQLREAAPTIQRELLAALERSDPHGGGDDRGGGDGGGGGRGSGGGGGGIKRAVTHWRALARGSFASSTVSGGRRGKNKNKTGHLTLLECQLETGRTHQIRVHASSCQMGARYRR